MSNNRFQSLLGDLKDAFAETEALNPTSEDRKQEVILEITETMREQGITVGDLN